MTSTENVTDWHQLSDQLTPRQVAEMEMFERDSAEWPTTNSASLLRCARGMVEANLTQVRFADIPVPADAIGDISDWQEWDHGVWNRHYTAKSIPCDKSSVEVSCWQYSDGRPDDRSIYLDTEESLDAAAARALAAALCEDSPPFK